MIGEPKFGEWNQQNPAPSNETQPETSPDSERLSEEEAFDEASRMESKIQRHWGEMDYDKAERVAEVEKPLEAGQSH